MTTTAAELPLVIVGAGAVGVALAWSLSRRGRRVAVVDALAGPADLCSRANAGILAVGHARAWASPQAPGAMISALRGDDPSVRVTRLWDAGLWRWGAAFLAQCPGPAHRRNTDKLQRLSRLGRALLQEAEAEMDLPRDTRHEGGLYLFQDQAQFRAYAASLQAGGAEGVEPLTRAELLAREPALAGLGERLAGGAYSAHDAVGDCRLFTRRAAERLAERGVAFHLSRRVTGLRRARGRIAAVETNKGPIPCAGVILATGAETAALTRPLGFAPLIQPVKGYSGTWRIQDPGRIPRLPFVDETELLAVASYGGQLRVTAIAEFAGRDLTLPSERLSLLKDYVALNFRGGVEPSSFVPWAGLRPTTPAGPPFLGRARRFENLWLNAGHGQLGWTMSLSCAEILAARIAGQTPALADVSASARWLEAA